MAVIAYKVTRPDGRDFRTGTATGPAWERVVDGSCTVPSTAPRVETSPSGDERHRAVPCQRCGRQTWNWSALCNEHRRSK